MHAGPHTSTDFGHSCVQSYCREVHVFIVVVSNLIFHAYILIVVTAICHPPTCDNRPCLILELGVWDWTKDGLIPRFLEFGSHFVGWDC